MIPVGICRFSRCTRLVSSGVVFTQPGSIPADGAPFGPMTACGQNRPSTRTVPKVRLQIREQTFEPIAAAQNDLFVSFVGSTILKRKQLVGAALNDANR